MQSESISVAETDSYIEDMREKYCQFIEMQSLVQKGWLSKSRIAGRHVAEASTVQQTPT